MRKKLLLTGILIIVGQIACTFRGGRQKTFDFKGFPFERLSLEEKYPQAGAIILLDEAEVNLYKTGDLHSSRMERHMVVKILNRKGYGYANIVIPFASETVISDIEAKTVLPDGTIIPLKQKNIFETDLFPSSLMYADLKAKRFTMPGIVPGCIVEYRWTQTVKNFTYWTKWYFQHTEPVKLSRYTVRCPSRWEIEWKTYGSDKVRMFKEDYPEGFKAVREWEIRDIPPFIPEDGMPPGSNVMANITFSPVHVKKWSDISAWYNRLAADAEKPGAAVKKKVARLIAEEDTGREKARKILRFVRDSIRYVAIEIGIGGFRPHEATEVLRVRYGDCKDMATLMVAMGKAAGVNIRPVLLSTWGHGETDTFLVSHSWFNHAIVVLKDDADSLIFMDPTHKKTAFGDLPWNDRNRLAMIIDADGSECFVTTPASGPDDNTESAFWDIHADSEGNIYGSLTLSYKGAQAASVRYTEELIHPISLKTYLAKKLLQYRPALTVDSVYVINDNNYGLPLKIVAMFRSAFGVKPPAEGLLWRVGDFGGPKWYLYFGEDERKYDVNIGYPLREDYKVKITYPAEMEVKFLPASDTLKSPFGMAALTAEKIGDGEIGYAGTFILDSIKVKKENYADFKRFLNEAVLLYDRIIGIGSR